MGMDVYGRAPGNEVGTYFRANVWSWCPLHSLMAIALDRLEDTDFISPETFGQMRSNDGAGINDEDGCKTLADSLEIVLQQLTQSPALACEQMFEVHDGRLYFSNDHASVFVDKNGKFVDESRKNEPGIVSAYSVEIDHVKEFIEFLRNCGGFEVY